MGYEVSIQYTKKNIFTVPHDVGSFDTPTCMSLTKYNVTLIHVFAGTCLLTDLTEMEVL